MKTLQVGLIDAAKHLSLNDMVCVQRLAKFSVGVKQPQNGKTLILLEKI